MPTARPMTEDFEIPPCGVGATETVIASELTDVTVLSVMDAVVPIVVGPASGDREDDAVVDGLGFWVGLGSKTTTPGSLANEVGIAELDQNVGPLSTASPCE